MNKNTANQSTPKISIIVPVYNMEKYLEECLKSIEAQTNFESLEVILVNDGSTDKSLSIIKEHASRYENFVVIDQINSGVSAARNNGIKAAKGEYVCFVDPDDFYPAEDTLEKLYAAAVNHGMLIAGGSFSKWENGILKTDFSGVYKKYTFQKEGVVKYSDYQFDYGYHRFIYSRKMLLENDIFYPPYIRFQDPPFFVKAMITAKQFYAIPDITYCYRVGHQNIEWTQKKTSHLLQGLTDNLRMSREENLSRLHWLTLRRLFSECKDRISHNFSDPEIKECLVNFQRQIDVQLLLSQQDNIWLDAKKAWGEITSLKRENEELKSSGGKIKKTKRINNKIKTAVKIFKTSGIKGVIQAVSRKIKKNHYNNVRGGVIQNPRIFISNPSYAIAA